MPTIHRLKITLRDVKPPVWRRIEVDSRVKLDNLAAILEDAMGWDGYHLHAFEIDDVAYRLPQFFDDSPWGRRSEDESKHQLGNVLSQVGTKARWDYDFGDGWEHNIVVEAIEPADPAIAYPRCVTGRRACPPEDCGGSWGYANLLEAIADPSHEEHAELTDWIGSSFDPEYFDADETTEDMQMPRMPQSEQW